MSETNYLIREATANDRAEWELLWLAYIEFYESSMPADITEQLWQRICDPGQDIQCHVAESEGRLIGMVQFFPHSHTWYAGPVCYLNDLFVSPEGRTGGVGAALIDAVVSEAKRHNWAEVYWHTRQTNQVARGLYDKITGGTDGFINYTIDVGSYAG